MVVLPGHIFGPLGPWADPDSGIKITGGRSHGAETGGLQGVKLASITIKIDVRRYGNFLKRQVIHVPQGVANGGRQLLKQQLLDIVDGDFAQVVVDESREV